MLADFCFADLLLFVPVAARRRDRFVVLGQVRPTTTQTLYRHDLVGEVVDEDERPLVARALRLGRDHRGRDHRPASASGSGCCASRCAASGRTIAVLTRESTPSVGRAPGELERTYVEIFNRFARMIAAGEFPFPPRTRDATSRRGSATASWCSTPTGRVEYASPNAVSALHRIGVHANTEGMRLGELGLDDEPIAHRLRHRSRP